MYSLSGKNESLRKCALGLDTLPKVRTITCQVKVLNLHVKFLFATIVNRVEIVSSFEWRFVFRCMPTASTNFVFSA